MKQWTVYIDPEDPERIPFLVISESALLPSRPPSIPEAERACRMLNEEGTNVVRVSCHTKDCKDFGGWVERARKDLEKHVVHCQVCGKAMER